MGSVRNVRGTQRHEISQSNMNKHLIWHIIRVHKFTIDFDNSVYFVRRFYSLHCVVPNSMRSLFMTLI